MRKLVAWCVSALFAGTLSQAAAAWEPGGTPPRLESNSVIVVDQEQGASLYAKNPQAVIDRKSVV